eukprot:Unigene3757_Nuclearia_a/m.11469 Unigene3757_Nuclearia_a/g.11469  ORF Unigene3757_Nuclearia_a/g.11469 Unigene3757_Nuclearia_a/m.11469 type:complete len:181 (+) Unigene3757_Nuclearia_a:101-643(+)
MDDEVVPLELLHARVLAETFGAVAAVLQRSAEIYTKSALGENVTVGEIHSISKAPKQTAIKRKKQLKDPNAPSRPRTAFLLFSEDERPKIKEEQPGLLLPDQTKILAQRWKDLPPRQKQFYEQQAHEAMDKYKTDMTSYRHQPGSPGNDVDSPDAGLGEAPPKKKHKDDDIGRGHLSKGQ